MRVLVVGLAAAEFELLEPTVSAERMLRRATRRCDGALPLVPNCQFARQKSITRVGSAREAKSVGKLATQSAG